LESKKFFLPLHSQLQTGLANGKNELEKWLTMSLQLEASIVL